MMKIAIFVDIQNIYYTTKEQFNRSFNYKNFWKKIASTGNIIKANAYAIDKGDPRQQKFQYAIQSIGFNVKLKPFISRSDGSAKGDWDVGITIDVLDSAKEVEKIILLSGDGDFDLLVKKVIEDYDCVVDVYGVEKLTANSLIDAASNFHAISDQFLI